MEFMVFLGFEIGKYQSTAIRVYGGIFLEGRYGNLGRETREGNGGWSDGAKHDDRARSYKGVVINGNTGQQNKEKDSREYYGKGKGKMFEAPDSKWVKVDERGYRRPSHQHGNYRGDSEGSRHKPTRREDVRNGGTEVGAGARKTNIRPSSGQSRADQGQRVPPQEVREEGEIKNNGDDDTMLLSIEFQLELAKTQAEGTEVILESTDEDKGLRMVRGMVEKHDDIAEDFEMEMDAINATLTESVHIHTHEEEELVNGDADIEKETGEGDLATMQGNRKRLFKPTISTAGSTKMRMASALVSPRKRVAAKVGSRHGDNSKPTESKGPSNPKPDNLKF
ncbi:hypothetical protein DY000_02007430 [Brassica cretica]|uniref:Uncharacterized protein n=1 Tax=Brassica cretica TaxID=69181 RepID=A0ABQ7BUR3_BRACR|nr:hypothetical protein DY000_02007430 [Brassica cretica]